MAARTNMGQIQEFCPDSESSTAYVERVELFFTANDIPAEKKVPVFLSVVGGTTYGLLRNLLAPASPKDKSFNTLQASILFLNLFLQSRRQPSPPKQHTGKYTFCAARVLRNDCCLKQT